MGSYTAKRADSDSNLVYDEVVDVKDINFDNTLVPSGCEKGANGAPVCTYDDGSAQTGTIGVGDTAEKCDLKKSSGLPAQLFADIQHDSLNAMYKSFCDYILQSGHRSDVWWEVNNKGDKTNDLISKRTPPVSSNEYPNALAYLRFVSKTTASRYRASQVIVTRRVVNLARNPITPWLREVVRDLHPPDGDENAATIRYFLGNCAGGELNAMATSGYIGAGCGVYHYEAYSHKGDAKAPTYSGLQSNNQ